MPPTWDRLCTCQRTTLTKSVQKVHCLKPADKTHQIGSFFSTILVQSHSARPPQPALIPAAPVLRSGTFSAAWCGDDCRCIRDGSVAFPARENPPVTVFLGAVGMRAAQRGPTAALAMPRHGVTQAAGHWRTTRHAPGAIAPALPDQSGRTTAKRTRTPAHKSR